jgi:hypothetical protein
MDVSSQDRHCNDIAFPGQALQKGPPAGFRTSNVQGIAGITAVKPNASLALVRLLRRNPDSCNAALRRTLVSYPGADQPQPVGPGVGQLANLQREKSHLGARPSTGFGERLAGLLRGGRGMSTLGCLNLGEQGLGDRAL